MEDSKTRNTSKAIFVTASPSPGSRADTEQVRGAFEGLNLRTGGNARDAFNKITQFDAKEMEGGKGKQAFEYYLSLVLGHIGQSFFSAPSGELKVTNTRKLQMGPSQQKSTNIPLQGMGASLYTPVYNSWAHIIDYMPYYDITVWAHAWYIYYQVVAYGPM